MRSDNTWFSMKGILSILSGFFVLLSAASTPALAATQWNVGVSGGDEGLRSFHLSIGDYYHVPERDVVIVEKRGIQEEELPVVFFIADRAHVPPGSVVELRLRGMNWMDITLHFGLSPEIYYVPVRQGPPYGNAYGYYKKHHKGGWQRGDLRDADIVNQVNLKFISEHHGYAPEKVMKYRSEGKSFTAIDREVRQGRPGAAQFQNPKADKPGKDKGKNKKEKYGKQKGNDHDKGKIKKEKSDKKKGKDHDKGKGKKWEDN